ncbi:hypothetical protein SDC9_81178 [bioreactor metagenome]|uniref:Uncharacterized protein n=1 Tax=bioreactor metagenome TaxID=1076179 RepID=A0A644Z1I3_9ZZZZ
MEIDKTLLVEVLGIDHRRVDVGEHLEFRRAADVVAIAAGAVADDLAAIHLTDLPRLERLDHAVLLGHTADPLIALDGHPNHSSHKGLRRSRLPATALPKI